ncbi:hypothetical protein [Dactylosporangium sp. NPDC051541]|uniref:hypothetical protein n=1 Tax=Dactylosporangium sp. NPDC051541 TaxID=3363977 RepID=UPI0037946005
MSRMGPTAWLAVIVSGVAASVALGTAVAVAAQGETFPGVARKQPLYAPPVPSPTAPAPQSVRTAQGSDGLVGQGGSDGQPCVWVSRESKKQALPYRCPLLWNSSKTSAAMTRIPVYRSPWSDTEPESNELYREAGEQYFRCHTHGVGYTFPAQYGWGTARHTWWALTQGDQRPGVWGFVPEVYFLGGADNEPDPGLPVCTDAEIALAAR